MRLNPLSFFFARSRSEQYVTRYLLREHARGRRIEDVLDDPYVRNRLDPDERAKLFERPEVIAAIGEQTAAEMKRLVESAGRREPISA